VRAVTGRFQGQEVTLLREPSDDGYKPSLAARLTATMTAIAAAKGNRQQSATRKHARV